MNVDLRKGLRASAIKSCTTSISKQFQQNFTSSTIWRNVASHEPETTPGLRCLLRRRAGRAQQAKHAAVPSALQAAGIQHPAPADSLMTCTKQFCRAMICDFVLMKCICKKTRGCTKARPCQTPKELLVHGEPGRLTPGADVARRPASCMQAALLPTVRPTPPGCQEDICCPCLALQQRCDSLLRLLQPRTQPSRVYQRPILLQHRRCPCLVVAQCSGVLLAPLLQVFARPLRVCWWLSFHWHCSRWHRILTRQLYQNVFRSMLGQLQQ